MFGLMRHTQRKRYTSLSVDWFILSTSPFCPTTSCTKCIQFMLQLITCLLDVCQIQTCVTLCKKMCYSNYVLQRVIDIWVHMGQIARPLNIAIQCACLGCIKFFKFIIIVHENLLSIFYTAYLQHCRIMFVQYLRMRCC